MSPMFRQPPQCLRSHSEQPLNRSFNHHGLHESDSVFNQVLRNQIHFSPLASPPKQVGPSHKLAD